MKPPLHILPPPIIAELERTGLPWSIVRGSRHYRLLIEGNQVAVFGQRFEATGGHHATRSFRGHIRRYVRNRLLA